MKKKRLALTILVLIFANASNIAHTENSYMKKDNTNQVIHSKKMMVEGKNIQVDTIISNGKEILAYKALDDVNADDKYAITNKVKNSTLKNEYATLETENSSLFYYDGYSEEDSQAQVHCSIQYDCNTGKITGSNLHAYGGYTDGYWSGSNNPDKIVIFQKYIADAVGVALSVSSPFGLSFSGSSFHKEAVWTSETIYDHYFLHVPHEDVSASCYCIYDTLAIEVQDGADIYVGSRILKARTGIKKKWSEIFYHKN